MFLTSLHSYLLPAAITSKSGWAKNVTLLTSALDKAPLCLKTTSCSIWEVLSSAACASAAAAAASAPSEADDARRDRTGAVFWGGGSGVCKGGRGGRVGGGGG